MKTARSICQDHSLAFLFWILTFVHCMSPATGTAGVSGPAQRAPISPAFVGQLELSPLNIVQSISDEGYPLGYFPPPVSLPSSTTLRAARLGNTATKLPVKYDLRNRARLTEVRDQGNCGSCWTFATYASLESWLLRPAAPEVWDFSEEDMNHRHGFSIQDCQGGNHFMSTAYLAGGSGPLREADSPYPYAAASYADLPVMKHVKEVLFLPGRAHSTDNEVIKQAIRHRGAVYCSFQYSSGFYNSEHSSYWNPQISDPNHAVAIVGWDDRFPANRFKPVAGAYPKGDGAFIIRNSWGTGWGEEGYFYLSYYDASLGEFVSFIKARQPSTYSHVYEYDPLGWIRSAGFGSDTAWFANIFTANSEDTLISGVGFYTQQTNCPYEISIYKNVQDGKPASGNLVKTVKATMPTAGYHTVGISPAANIKGGKKFSIVVKLTTPGYGFPVAIEEPLVGYSAAAKAYTGQSFMSNDGHYWSDITHWDSWESSNVCLKAFASEAEN